MITSKRSISNIDGKTGRTFQINNFSDPYKVTEGEQACVLGQQVGAKLSSTQRQEDS